MYSKTSMFISPHR